MVMAAVFTAITPLCRFFIFAADSCRFADYVKMPRRRRQRPLLADADILPSRLFSPPCRATYAVFAAATLPPPIAFWLIRHWRCIFSPPLAASMSAFASSSFRLRRLPPPIFACFRFGDTPAKDIIFFDLPAGHWLHFRITADMRCHPHSPPACRRHAAEAIALYILFFDSMPPEAISLLQHEATASFITLSISRHFQPPPESGRRRWYADAVSQFRTLARHDAGQPPPSPPRRRKPPRPPARRMLRCRHCRFIAAFRLILTLR